ALSRLDAEKETLAAEISAGAERRTAAEGRVEEAGAALVSAEQVADAFTRELADLTARRNQLESAAREQDDRLARLSREVEDVAGELASLDGAGVADLSQLQGVADAAQSAIVE